MRGVVSMEARGFIDWRGYECGRGWGGGRERPVGMELI